jgi:hypothetical protein
MSRIIEHVAQDQPIGLARAARIAFPDRSRGVSFLRAEIAAGRLPATTVEGRAAVTLAAIRDALEAPASSPAIEEVVPAPETTSVLVQTPQARSQSSKGKFTIKS